MTITESNQSNVYAVNSINQLLGAIKSAKNRLDNGAPAQSSIPAVTPTDMSAAFGVVNATIVNLCAAAVDCTDAAKLAVALAALQ